MIEVKELKVIVCNLDIWNSQMRTMQCNYKRGIMMKISMMICHHPFSLMTQHPPQMNWTIYLVQYSLLIYFHMIINQAPCQQK